MTSPRVIPDLIGNLYKLIPYSLFIVFTFFALVFSPVVFASAKSDYDYQYGQYRRSYFEFNLLKADYLQTPSLDNQQKAMLLAKQTILSRDLAKASFSWYILDLIGSTKTDYPPIQPIISSLAISRQFYLSEAQKSQSVITQEDLKKFTLAYTKAVPHHDRMIKFGILANKLATLVRIQLDSTTAIDDLVSKLPTSLPATVTARIQELRESTKVIDAKIDLLAKNLDFVESPESADAEIFFSSRVEKMAEIQTLQLDWIDRLIDLEKNYAQPNR